jgi:hypothetical protein
MAKIITDPAETLMGEGDVDTDHWDQSAITLLLVVFDGLTIYQDLGNGLDVRRKLDKLVSETLYVGDLKEKVGLCLLGKAAPVSLTF